MELIKRANKIYLQHFKPETCFERAVFFSWYCRIRDCKFCYMSTTEQEAEKGVRSMESLLAESVLCKKLGWDIGFLSGGIGAFEEKKLLDLVKNINLVTKEKIWLNVGVLNEKQLKKFKPYIKGVVGSIETVNDKVHKHVCPSKPVEPYVEMFSISSKLNLKNAMTIILGLGETKKDYEMLKNLIKDNKIEKIHFYCLNPQKGTVFEGKKSPTAPYQAWWIAKTRVDFPKIDIQFGIWRDKTDRVSLLLNAGANSISKFPAIVEFNSKYAKEIEMQAKKAGRRFKGTLTKMPAVDWNKEVDKLNLDKDLKGKIKIKLGKYIQKMEK